MSRNKTILERIRAFLESIDSQDILLIALFGSMARGNFHERSDVDLLLVVKDMDEEKVRGIEKQLRRGLRALLKRKVSIWTLTHKELVSRLEYRSYVLLSAIEESLFILGDKNLFESLKLAVLSTHDLDSNAIRLNLLEGAVFLSKSSSLLNMILISLIKEGCSPSGDIMKCLRRIHRTLLKLALLHLHYSAGCVLSSYYALKCGKQLTFRALLGECDGDEYTRVFCELSDYVKIVKKTGRLDINLIRRYLREIEELYYKVLLSGLTE